MQLVSLLSHCATDPGLKSGISVHKLISTLKKKKKRAGRNQLSNILPKSSHTKKKPPPLPLSRPHNKWMRLQDKTHIHTPEQTALTNENKCGYGKSDIVKQTVCESTQRLHFIETFKIQSSCLVTLPLKIYIYPHHVNTGCLHTCRSY